MEIREWCGAGSTGIQGAGVVPNGIAAQLLDDVRLRMRIRWTPGFQAHLASQRGRYRPILVLGLHLVLGPPYGSMSDGITSYPTIFSRQTLDPLVPMAPTRTIKPLTPLRHLAPKMISRLSLFLTWIVLFDSLVVMLNHLPDARFRPLTLRYESDDLGSSAHADSCLMKLACTSVIGSEIGSEPTHMETASVCWDWKNGRCWRGAGCKYVHHEVSQHNMHNVSVYGILLLIAI
jgi:hypothetical protein